VTHNLPLKEENIKVPRELRELLLHCLKTNQNNSEVNLQLLYKFYPYYDYTKFSIEKWMKEIVKLPGNFDNEKYMPKKNREMFKIFYNMHLNLLKNLDVNQHYKTFKFKKETEWRLIIDLGGPSVFETNLNIHPFDSYPRIPGSAIKGVMRHLLYNTKEMLKDSHRPKESEQLYRILETLLGRPADKGKQTNKGNLVIFDAIPAIIDENKNVKNLPIYALDAMTPHYSDYYQSNKPPGDWCSPNPIIFLTIAPLKWFFSFAISEVAYSKVTEELKKINKTLTFDDFLDDTLSNALSLGIGAKTNAGYGCFL